MSVLYQFAFGLACGALLFSCGRPAEAPDSTPERVVSLSGAITETLHTLGHGEKIVGVDVTSTYPAEITQLPQIGHVSQLNAEAILGLTPDLIIAETGERDNPVLQQLAESGIEMLYIPKPNTLDAPVQLATAIAEKLGDPYGKLDALIQQVGNDRQELRALTVQRSDRPTVLFIYARGKGNLMVAGAGTSAEAMITAAGGTNAAVGFEGFRAFSAEGLIEAQPEVILMFESGVRSLEGEEELLKLAGVSQTPAGRRRRIITMDGHYLLGFGPRAAEAALELAKQLQENTVL